MKKYIITVIICLFSTISANAQEEIKYPNTFHDKKSDSIRTEIIRKVKSDCKCPTTFSILDSNFNKTDEMNIPIYYHKSKSTKEKLYGYRYSINEYSKTKKDKLIYSKIKEDTVYVFNYCGKIINRCTEPFVRFGGAYFKIEAECIDTIECQYYEPEYYSTVFECVSQNENGALVKVKHGYFLSNNGYIGKYRPMPYHELNREVNLCDGFNLLRFYDINSGFKIDLDIFRINRYHMISEDIDFGYYRYYKYTTLFSNNNIINVSINGVNSLSELHSLF